MNGKAQYPYAESVEPWFGYWIWEHTSPMGKMSSPYHTIDFWGECDPISHKGPYGDNTNIYQMILI